MFVIKTNLSHLISPNDSLFNDYVDVFNHIMEGAIFYVGEVGQVTVTNLCMLLDGDIRFKPNGDVDDKMRTQIAEFIGREIYKTHIEYVPTNLASIYSQYGVTDKTYWFNSDGDMYGLTRDSDVNSHRGTVEWEQIKFYI